MSPRSSCQLPVTPCRPNQIDRGRHGARGPLISYSPFPTMHQPACRHPILASVWRLYISLSRSLCLSFTLRRTIINANMRACVHTVNLHSDKMRRWVRCFYKSKQTARCRALLSAKHLAETLQSKHHSLLQACMTDNISSPA